MDKLVPCGTAAVILDSDKCVLMGKRGASINGAGQYALPGGRLEPFETVQEGVVREVSEETDIGEVTTLIMTSINVFSAAHDAGSQWWVTLYVPFHIKAAGVQVKNREPDKCEGWSWYTWDEVLNFDSVFGGKDTTAAIEWAMKVL